MASKKKLLQAAAGSAGGAGLDVDEVFSTFLYDGTGSAQTITNNIDLSGEGGLTWIKGRMAGGFSHYLFDTERGVTKYIRSNETNAEGTDSNSLTAFNSNGFSVGSANITNYNTGDFVSWTFRKAPKFFDVVTYSGNSTAGRTVSHSLGSVPGMIIVKTTNASDDWRVYHRGVDSSNPENYVMYLNDTRARVDAPRWNDTAPTSTEFTLGSDSSVNGSGRTYVAYIFAHNNSDGEFGPDSDQDIIKCGSYTGTGAKLDINIGFEAQWVMIKQTDASRDWHLFDVMRGMPVGSDASWLEANTSDPEANNAYMSAHPTGFTLPDGHPEVCANGGNYIYMAIRRGPLAAPDDATKVFAVQDGRGASKLFTAGFPIDTFIMGDKNGDNWQVKDRLRGQKDLATNSTAAETANTFYYFDDQTGLVTSSGGGSALAQLTGYMWKRAPSYFDVCCYTGNDTAGRTVSHNLGAVPEMMWVKRRDVSRPWFVYNKDLDASNPSHKYLKLNETEAVSDDVSIWNDTAPTSSVFTVGDSNNVNSNGSTYIAYLFASVDGVSKVGSYTGNGSTQNIDCGFSSGARFVLIKRTDTSEGWKVHDSVRGIVAGDDPFLELNNTNAENSSFDLVDPYSGGFAVNNFVGWNASGGSYIFYAIA
jgi:hypothetical protein